MSDSPDQHTWDEEDDRTIDVHGLDIEVVAFTRHHVAPEGITTRTWHTASVDVDDVYEADELRDLALALLAVADELDQLNGVPLDDVDLDAA